MRVVRLIDITPAKILSSSLAEDDAPPWTAGSYNADDEVVFAHRVWRALETTADQPDEGAALDPPTWRDLGATNRMRAFDGRVGHKSVSDAPIVYELAPGQMFDSVMVLGVEAPQVRLRVLDAGDAVLSDQTVTLRDSSMINGWFSWFFEPIAVRHRHAFLGLTGGSNIRLELTVGDGAGSYALGEVIVGRAVKIGDLRWNTRVGIQDFSRKTRDPDFGDWDVTERDYSDTIRYPVEIRTAQEEFVRRTLAAVRARPTLYIGALHRPGSFVYGIFEDFEVVWDNSVTSICELSVSSML